MAKTRTARTRSIVKKQPSLAQLQRATQSNTENPVVWRAYGIRLVQEGLLEQAQPTLERARALQQDDVETLTWLGYCLMQQNQAKRARELLGQAIEFNPQHAFALLALGTLEQDAGRHEQALRYFERSEQAGPDNPKTTQQKAIALGELSRFEEGLEVYEQLIKRYPTNFLFWNGAAHMLRSLGRFENIEHYYRKGIEYAGDDPLPYSNFLTLVHYSPKWTRQEIYDICQEWQSRYAPKKPAPRPVPEDRSPTRKLRLGFFSDGFRIHPVGSMIIKALEALSPKDVELYFYPMHGEHDYITDRFQKIATRWTPAKYMKSSKFEETIRNDQIDILFDLAGHHKGTRSKTMANQPAPLIVKWVGGLINTTGIEAMDYLLSDHVETPPGPEEDAFYGEKLIRLPDDYIVFSVPRYMPPLAELPALKNGYITLGCFNNPTKITPALLDEWALLLQQLPTARLFLKGHPYTSEEFRERIIVQFEEREIARERIIIEGPARHRAFLQAYNKVDIALDTWPYSGGLTSCEAFLMGVPLVSLPGPTFAGRHSATHLTNAGMPELVVSSWDEYRERVIELASDLDSLATIRRHLREVLLESPVCDSRRFARHFMTAVRAIWTRYCEGLAPAALSFDKTGQAWFEDQTEPVSVQVYEPEEAEEQGFQWRLPGRVMVLDNSSKLLQGRGLETMLRTKAFTIVAFDPRSLVANPERFQGSDRIQLFQHALLGDGKPSTLYACLEPGLSSTLKPKPPEVLPEDLRSGAQVLTELPISTVALDSIEGLEGLDWLVLDHLSDATTILEHGTRTLKDCLLIEVRTAFERSHEQQPSLDEISHWASRNGFRFCRFERPLHRSHLPKRDDLKKRSFSELVSADALFIPSRVRMDELSDAQRIKLAFLLHTFYGLHDLCYALLAAVNEQKAEAYLISEGIIPPPLDEGDDGSAQADDGARGLGDRMRVIDIAPVAGEPAATDEVGLGSDDEAVGDAESDKPVADTGSSLGETKGSAADDDTEFVFD